MYALFAIRCSILGVYNIYVIKSDAFIDFLQKEASVFRVFTESEESTFLKVQSLAKINVFWVFFMQSASQKGFDRGNTIAFYILL